MPKKEILKKNLKNITEGSVSYKRALKRAKKALEDLDAIAVGQTIRGKKGEDVVIDKEHDKKILSALRHIEDVQNKITDGSIEQAVDKKKKKEQEEVSKSNEQSEGYGKMPEEVMDENVVSISEETLKNVIRRVVLEQTSVAKKMAEAVAKMKKDKEKVIEGVWDVLKKFLSPKEVKEIDEDKKKELLKQLKSML